MPSAFVLGSEKTESIALACVSIAKSSAANLVLDNSFAAVNWLNNASPSRESELSDKANPETLSS